jgi:hypothetical protein
MDSLVEEISTGCLGLEQAPETTTEAQHLVALADRLEAERARLLAIATTWKAEEKN